MKRGYFLLFAILTCFFAACSDDDDNKDGKMGVTVSLSAPTTDFQVINQDVEAKFVVTADKAVPSNLVVTFSVEGGEEGVHYKMDPARYTIVKGETTTEGSITFLARAFDETGKTLTLNMASKKAEVGTGSVNFTLKGDSPVIIPETKYPEVGAAWAAYSAVQAYGIGELVVSKEYTGDEWYSDLHATSIARINKDKNMAYITVDQAQTGKGDPYTIAMWVDWNGDGDFEDAGEEVMYEEWKADGLKTYQFPLNPPAGAQKVGRIRFGIFFSEGDTDFAYGAGTIDSGDIIDVTYFLSDGHIEDPEPVLPPAPPVEEDTYCIPDVMYSAYGVCGGYKFGGLDVTKEYTGEEGWVHLTDAVAKLHVGENEVTIIADQAETGAGDPYIIAMWIDFNGDGDFSDEGEQVIYEAWSAEGVKTFTKTITVPAGAVETSRIRFGVYYAEGETTLENGCGAIDSGDLIDIDYTLE